MKEQRGTLAGGGAPVTSSGGGDITMEEVTAYRGVASLWDAGEGAFVDCTRVIINLLNTSEFSIRCRVSPLKMAPNSFNLLLCLLPGIC